MRNKLVGTILAVLLALGMLAIALGASPARATTTQCVGTAIPSGQVVTELYTTAGCGSASYNTEALSPVASGVAMCNPVMSVPSGWVAKEIYNSGNCGPTMAYGNTYVLATPSA